MFAPGGTLRAIGSRAVWPVQGLVAIAVVAVTASASGIAPDTIGRGASAHALEQATERAVALYRLREGVGELARSRTLDLMAREHSRDMASRRFAAHGTPDGRSTIERAAAYGLTYARIGENIARMRKPDDPVRRAVEGWIHSPSHRSNLLDPAFTETGIGVAVDAEGTVYFTQVFVEGR